MAVKLFVENARIAFAKGLFVAEAMEEGQTKKFGADFLLHEGSKVFKVTEVDGVKTRTPVKVSEAMIEVANEVWKGKGKEMLAALEGSKKCYRDGNLRMTKAGEVYAGFEGLKYISAKNQTRPTVINKDRTPVAEADGVIYSGCYVNVSLEIYGMSDPKKKGVHASLKGVQFFADGESFGGGGAAASVDEFDDLSDTGSASEDSGDDDLC